jgi:hypothetical protein
MAMQLAHVHATIDDSVCISSQLLVNKLVHIFSFVRCLALKIPTYTHVIAITEDGTPHRQNHETEEIHRKLEKRNATRTPHARIINVSNIISFNNMMKTE